MDHLLRDRASDERGLIVSWLGKLVIGFALAGIVLFDGGSILVNFFTLDSKADEIAVELTTNVVPTSLSLDTLEPRARELAKEAGAHLVDLQIEGSLVKVTLRRRADTLVVGRIGPIEDWARATVEGQAGAG
jgi:hypothetical protein